MRLLFFPLALLAAACVSRPPAVPDAARPDYAGLATAYAEAMLADGRDRYGPVHAPIFATMLDRQTMRLLEDPEATTPMRRDVHGVRTIDRSWNAANPDNDVALHELLYRLTEDTGEARYAAAADASYAWFLRNTQHPSTGLLAWGEHTAWHLEEERPTRHPDNRWSDLKHETHPLRPFWDDLFRLDSARAIRYADGLWACHVYDKEAGLHAHQTRYDTCAPDEGFVFPRMAGNMVRVWALAYAATDDEATRRRMLGYIHRIASAEHARRDADGFIIRMHPREGQSWRPGTTLQGLADAHHALDGPLPDSTRRLLRAWAARSDDNLIAFFDSLGTTLRTPALAAATEGMTLWCNSYGQASTLAARALQTALRYRQTGREGYLRFTRRAADQYDGAEPACLAYPLWPSALADAIDLLLEVHALTAEPRYLHEADRLGRRASTLFLDDASPLPNVFADGYDHYEALTGGPDLMLALYRLGRTLDGSRGFAVDEPEVDVARQMVAAMDTLYRGLYPFFATLYDPATGGFYESPTRKTAPRLESTARALTALDRAGALQTLPDTLRQGFADFFNGFQDPTTGFFEDLQEDRDADMRRGRALGYATGALARLSVAPRYPLPVEARATPEEEPEGIAHLRSPEALVAWLEALDWTEPWKAGGTVSAQRTLIDRLPPTRRDALLDALFAWLEREQDPATGWWGMDAPYRQLSGAFKLGMVYEHFGRPMPRADRVYASLLRTMREEEALAATWVRNPLHLLRVVRPDVAAIPPGERAEIARIAIDNIRSFRRPDGGFAMSLHEPYGRTDGVSQAMKTRDALRALVGLPPTPFSGGEGFLRALEAATPHEPINPGMPVLTRRVRVPEALLHADGYMGDLRMGDLDGDGAVEFVVYRSRGDGMKPSTIAAFDAAGTVLWQAGAGGEQPARPGSVAAYDLDGDGADEVIHFFMEDDLPAVPDSCLGDVVVQVRDGRTGRVLRQAQPAALREACGEGANWVHQRILVANLRGRDRPQDFVVKLGTTLLAFDDDLRTLWTYPIRWRDYGEHSAYTPAVGDLDGDGRDEVFGGYYLLGPEGTPIWEGAIARHMDSVVIAAWDGGRPRAIGSGFGHVFDAEGDVLLRLGEEAVPHGQEVRVADFLAEPPGPEMIIRSNGHRADVLTVANDGRVLQRWRLNDSPNHTGMEAVYWRGPDAPALLYNGGVLWHGDGERFADLPGLPEPIGDERMGWYHAIPADVHGDAREDLVVYNPWDRYVWIYSSAPLRPDAFGGYRAGPRQYNVRLMD